MTDTISGKDLLPERPEPIISELDLFLYDHQMMPRVAVEALVEGHFVLITDYFSSGLAVLLALKKVLKGKYADQSFAGQRDLRSVYRELSNHLLLFVSDHQLVVKKAPAIGWLKILYPELEEFLLPFPQVQGMNSSWQWHEKGISIPGLDQQLHPFFGTYFPTRFEHLMLFDHWLSQYKGDKKDAMDIGVGCGVLAFFMLKHSFEKVYGTDNSSNAIIGLQEEIDKSPDHPAIELLHGDLFADSTIQTELIVFNPPWIPEIQNAEGLDKSIYYDADLFPRFFSEAEQHMKPGGRLVLLFSNLAQITNASETHPIEMELANGGRYRKEVFIQKKVAPASGKTRRNQSWRSSEMVELWVLKAAMPN